MAAYAVVYCFACRQFYLCFRKNGSMFGRKKTVIGETAKENSQQFPFAAMFCFFIFMAFMQKSFRCIITNTNYKRVDYGNDNDSKILSAHAGLSSVKAGDLIEAGLDMVLANDITGPVAIHEAARLKKKTVFDKDKVALVPRPFCSNKDIKSAEHCKIVKEYAKAQE